MSRVLKILRVAILTGFALLAIASIVESMRSKTRGDSFAWQRWPTKAGKQLVISEEVQFNSGLVLYIHQEATTQFPRTSASWWGVFTHSAFDVRAMKVPGTTFWERRGFGRDWSKATATNIGGVTVSAHVTWFPMWLATVVFALPPVVTVMRAIVRRRRATRRGRMGLCIVCGYDVRAATERCPECGTEMSNVKGQMSKVKS